MYHSERKRRKSRPGVRGDREIEREIEGERERGREGGRESGRAEEKERESEIDMTMESKVRNLNLVIFSRLS